jgi:hypothetical protein
MIHLDNIIFSVTRLTYNEALGTNVLNASPSLSNVYGHLYESSTTLERGGSSNGSEQDRSPRYRLNCRLNDTGIEEITSGSIIRVTHKRHPDTAKWIAVSEDEQYVIHVVNRNQAFGREVAITLTRKDRV